MSNFIMSLLPHKGEEHSTMKSERTLSIIKPDALAKNVIGEIYKRFENGGLSIVAAKVIRFNKEQAEQFYAIHKERPFFDSLIRFMCSGPVMVQVLEGKNAILCNRDLMGATNPEEAEQGTIRADYAESIEANAVHGSDSIDTAKQEISFFFKDEDIHSRLLNSY